MAAASLSVGYKAKNVRRKIINLSRLINLQILQYAGLRVDHEQELPWQDGPQRRADLFGLAVHGSGFSVDGLCHRPEGVPRVDEKFSVIVDARTRPP